MSVLTLLLAHYCISVTISYLVTLFVWLQIKLTLCTADVENVVRPLWGTELDLFERLGLLQVRCAIDELTYKLEYCDFLLLPEIYTVLLALYDTAVDVVSETSLWRCLRRNSTSAVFCHWTIKLYRAMIGCANYNEKIGKVTMKS